MKNKKSKKKTNEIIITSSMELELEMNLETNYTYNSARILVSCHSQSNIIVEKEKTQVNTAVNGSEHHSIQMVNMD